MFRGVIISSVVHASVLAAAVFSWPNERSECDKLIDAIQEQQPGISPLDIAMMYPQCAASMRLPIDIVDIGLVTDIAPIVKPEEPPEEEPEEQKLEEQPDETLDDPTLEDEPEEEPVSKEQASEDEPEEVVFPEKEPEEVPEEAPKVEEKPEPPKEKKLIEKPKQKEASDDLSFLDDFEDTLKDKAKEQRRERPKDDRSFQKPELKNTEIERAGAGKGQGNTASLQAAMQRHIRGYWRSVDDLPEPERLVVTIIMELNRDGTIKGSPKFVKPVRPPIGDRYMRVAMERAMRAVHRAEPYQLPADDYDKWKEIEVMIGPEG